MPNRGVVQGNWGDELHTSVLPPGSLFVVRDTLYVNNSPLSINERELNASNHAESTIGPRAASLAGRVHR